MARCKIPPRGFPERLAQAIYDSGLNCCQISDRTGHKIERKSIYNWRVGNTVPNATQLMYLCKVLNVSADWLLGISNKKEIKRGNTKT
jgi:hypothetical protein